MQVTVDCILNIPSPYQAVPEILTEVNQISISNEGTNHEIQYPYGMHDPPSDQCKKDNPPGAMFPKMEVRYRQQ